MILAHVSCPGSVWDLFARGRKRKRGLVRKKYATAWRPSRLINGVPGYTNYYSRTKNAGHMHVGPSRIRVCLFRRSKVLLLILGAGCGGFTSLYRGTSLKPAPGLDPPLFGRRGR